MRINIRRLAPVGLYLSLASAIIAFGLYILKSRFDWVVGLFIGLFVIGFALYGILDPARVRQALTGRQARYGSNAVVMIIAFLGILIVANVLIYNYAKRWDLTKDQTHTLAPETIATLKKMPEKVTALAFFTTRIPSDTARQLLEDYKVSSGGNFDYQFINPESDPVAANAAKVTQDGSVVVEVGQRQEVVTSVTEQDLTSALIRLSASGQKTIYLLTGHGEYDYSGTGDKSLSDAQTALTSKSYVVKQLSLLTDHKIPADAAVIMVAGAQKPVSTDEVTLIKDFVAKGGSLIYLADPTPVTQFGDSPDPLADYLDQNWGIKLGQDFIIDNTSQYPGLAIADPSAYGYHPITNALIGKTVSIFPSARSVSTHAINNVTQTILAKTSSQSWAETDLKALAQNQYNFNQATDIQGPVSLAVAAENSSTKSRVVVFGNSSFAVNAYYTQYGTGDLLVNSVDWAAKQDNLINLTTKTTTQRVLVPPQNYVMSLIFLGFVFLIPGAVVVSGILVWVQRRRRG